MPNTSVPKNDSAFCALVSNLVGTMTRNETLEGRKYLVVPMVMMVEGVLNGSNGALYYPAEELAKVPQVWNMKPVVVYHPTMNGKALSACDPSVIEQYKVGIIMNTTFDGKRLKAEAWLEPERLEKIDKRVTAAINRGEMMEVSTGLFTENEQAYGVFGGKAYEAIARNYRPDHLAILPDQIGACSIEDGAGLLRVNVKSRAEMTMVLNSMGIDTNEVSLEGDTGMKGELIAKLIQNGNWVEGDKEFLESCTEEHLKKMLPVENKEPEATPEPAKVAAPVVEEVDGVEEVDEPTDNADEYLAKAPSDVMNVLFRKAELVAAITANKKNVFGKERLMGMSVSDLEGIAVVAAVNEKKKADYSGMAQVDNSAKTEVEVLDLPTPTFEKK